MKINILILSAGGGVHDSQDGKYPLCLSELDGISLIEKIIINTKKISSRNYTFALLEKEIKNYYLDQVAQLLCPGARIVSVPEKTKGSACTALLAASQLDPDASLLIVSANELVDLDLALPVESFHNQGFDAGTIIFRAVHPRYSYVTLNDKGLVTRVAQKKPISQNATAGIFWFKKTNDFVEAAKAIIMKSATTDENYFVAPSFNELILRQQKVGVYHIDNKKYHPLKTEKQLQQFGHGG